MKLWFLTAFFSLVPLFFSGCGGRVEGPERFSISGEVTLDGQPLESGSILFADPAGQIQSYFASIKNGQYRTDIEAGVWSVQITAIRESKDKMVPDGAGTAMVPAAEQYLPAKYNEKTELQVEIKPGEKNVFPFDLKSK